MFEQTPTSVSARPPMLVLVISWLMMVGGGILFLKHSASIVLVLGRLSSSPVICPYCFSGSFREYTASDYVMLTIPLIVDIVLIVAGLGIRRLRLWAFLLFTHVLVAQVVLAVIAWNDRNFYEAVAPIIGIIALPYLWSVFASRRKLELPINNEAMNTIEKSLEEAKQGKLEPLEDVLADK